MKIILIILLVIAASKATTWTLMNLTSGQETLTMDISESSSDASLTDLSFAYTPLSASSPFARGTGLQVVWADMGVSDFTPTSAQTGLKGFNLECLCSGPCAGLASSFFDVKLFAGTVFDYDLSTLSTSGALTTQIQYGGTSGSTRTNTSTVTTWSMSGMSAADLTASSLPTASENFYYKCWSKINTTDVDQTSAVSDWSTGATLLDVGIERNPPSTNTGSTNTGSTNTGSTSTSRAEVVTILAAAGSAVASFLL